MGREIVYCEGCGQRLTEDDFTRGKAQDHEGRPFCSKCRPVTEPPPAPQPQRGTERRTPAAVTTSRRRKATERIPFATAPGPPPSRPPESGSSHVGLGVGIGLAVLVLIIVAVATMGREKPAPAPDPVIGVPPMPKPPAVEIRPPAVDPAEERLKELESFAKTSPDPQAILARCEQWRSSFRNSPLEPRVRLIESVAQEKIKQREKEKAAEQERARLAEEAAKKKAEEKPPARNWSECFLLATNRVQANDYPGAKTIYVEGLATLPERRPEDLQQRAVYCIGLYNLACIYAVEAPKLSGQARTQAIDDAFKYLDWALRSDYGKFRCPCHPQTLGVGHMGDDKDMDPLRTDARYAALLQKYK